MHALCITKNPMTDIVLLQKCLNFYIKIFCEFLQQIYFANLSTVFVTITIKVLSSCWNSFCAISPD